MSGSVTATETAAGPGTTTRTGWRRHRSSLLIALALLAALALVVLTSGPVTRGADLDPDNPGPDGGQAVARVLADQGVELDVVRTAAELDEAAVGADTLVVVTSSSSLGTSTTDRLLDQVAAGDAGLVVVDPTATLLDELAVDGDLARLGSSDAVEAACDDETYADLTLAVDDGPALPLPGCFDDTLVMTDAAATGSRLTLLGAGGLLSNDQVLRADNAAIALRLLGTSERLVWYVASDSDQVAGDGVSLTSLLPAWVLPALALAFFATVLMVLWRGRRLGALATEPLPVVVKAIETTRSRGRLYRRHGDRAHAAEALRAATRARAAVRLRLGPSPDEATLVADIARHVDRPESEVSVLLGTAATPPGSDHDLITLANALAELEEEVRRP